MNVTVRFHGSGRYVERMVGPTGTAYSMSMPRAWLDGTSGASVTVDAYVADKPSEATLLYVENGNLTATARGRTPLGEKYLRLTVDAPPGTKVELDVLADKVARVRP